MRLGFGGGCHWCTEAIFAALRGVTTVEQGFIRSDPPDDSWSEAVHITFDPAQIDAETLIEIHLRTHASTSNHKMRGKYRSAIYVHSDDDVAEIGHILDRLQTGFADPLVTRVLPFRGFRASDPRFQNYHQKNAGGPFCTRYIDPKLDQLRSRFAQHLHGA